MEYSSQYLSRNAQKWLCFDLKIAKFYSAAGGEFELFKELFVDPRFQISYAYATGHESITGLNYL